MKYIIILILTFSSLYIISCGRQENSKKHFWIELSINKDLNYKALTVNGITNNENQLLIDGYLKEKNIQKLYFYSFRRNRDTLLIKLPLYSTAEELKKFKIVLKNEDTIIWQGFAFDDNIFSKEDFYQMKDEPCKDKLIDLFISIDGENNNLEYDYFYSIDENCKINRKQDKVMIGVNIANNSFNYDPIIKINDIDISDNIEENYIWNNFTRLFRLDVHFYSEENKSYEMNSGYWNILINRNNLENYKLVFLSKKGIKTTINLNEIQFCVPPKEKSFKELISEFKGLTYAFTLKNGIPRLDFQDALSLENNYPNCSKISGETSGYASSVDYLHFDRYGQIEVTEFNNGNSNYLFNDIKVILRYHNISNDPNEYKKTGYKRWALGVYSYFTAQTQDGFSLLIPWHLVKEGETLTINSNMIEQQPEEERSFWKKLFKPVYFSKNHSINFTSSNGLVIDYGDYQELTYDFIKVPKKYGDFLELNFHFLAKKGKDVLLNYEGKIKLRYFSSEIFHCFNEDKLWICPQKGFEDNFPWINRD